MFQGVLADNNAPGIYHWSSYLWMACLVSLALFAVQIAFHVKTPSVRPAVEPTDEIPPLPTAPQEQPSVFPEDSAPKDGE